MSKNIKTNINIERIDSVVSEIIDEILMSDSTANSSYIRVYYNDGKLIPASEGRDLEGSEFVEIYCGNYYLDSQDDYNRVDDDRWQEKWADHIYTVIYRDILAEIKKI